MLYLLNIAAFQVGWFSSVVGGASNLPWLGPLAVAVALILHFRAAERPRQELILLLSCAAMGSLFDSALVASGWVRYSSGIFNALAAPYWIIAMWMLFGTTLNVSLRWLRNRPVLSVLFGLLGGPVTYLAGEKLGGIILVDRYAALAALAVGWAVMMPFLLRLSANFDGFRPGAGTRLAIAGGRVS